LDSTRQERGAEGGAENETPKASR